MIRSFSGIPEKRNAGFVSETQIPAFFLCCLNLLKIRKQGYNMNKLKREHKNIENKVANE